MHTRRGAGPPRRLALLAAGAPRRFGVMAWLRTAEGEVAMFRARVARDLHRVGDEVPHGPVLRAADADAAVLFGTLGAEVQGFALD